MKFIRRRPSYHTGEVVQLMPDSIEPPSLAGAMVRIVRRSKRTGTLTVEFVASTGAYQKGDTLNVEPYQVHSAIVTR